MVSPHTRATRRVGSGRRRGSLACSREVHMLGRIGVLGFLGIIVFVGWAIGWIFFNLHDWHYHLLFLAAVVLMIAQGVTRIAR